MESTHIEASELKRKREEIDGEEPTETPTLSENDDGFEIPKAHIRKAMKKEKQLRAQAMIQKSQSRTTIAEIRNVLMWVLSESQGVMPKWCLIRNKNLVDGITVIITPFLDRLTLFEYAGRGAGISKEFPFFSHCIRGSMIPMTSVNFHRYPSICPVLSQFLSAPIGSKTAAQWVDKMSDDETESENHTTHKIADFLMTEDNRRSNEFPEPLLGGRLPPGFVTTKGKTMRTTVPSFDNSEDPALLHPKDISFLSSDPDYQNLVGIDCEMVETVCGKELARVSLVDYLGRVLYDSIVLPDDEITDYITQYSGITPAMIRDCRTSFKEAQKMVLSFLDDQAILVGHALQNDLQCLRLIHDRVIDTSDIFPHPNGHPSKHSLVFLLQRVIRESLDREGGHDSVDDARASLRIAMKKLARGHDYSPLGLQSVKYVPLGSLLGKESVKSVLYSAIDKEKEPAYKLQGFTHNPDEQVEEAKLYVHHLTQFQEACENNTCRKQAVMDIDQKIRDLTQGLGENHIVVVFSGCGDVFSFKRFEKLADMCNDETKRVDVEKALQRAKDKAVSAYAIISSVGDIPAEAREREHVIDE
jgi:DNA polymerase III epsilon subunit-like protein